MERTHNIREWLRVVMLCWPCLLCCVIASRQLWAATTGPLSAWKGGGFGMFATTDNPGNRVIHCVGMASSGERVIVRSDLPPGTGLSRGVLRRLQTAPTVEDLHALAQTLASLDYVLVDTSSNYLRESLLAQNPSLTNNVPTPRQWPVKIVAPRDTRLAGHGTAPPLTLDWVEARVWRVRFVGADRSLHIEPMLDAIRADRVGNWATGVASENGQ